jgi:proteasome inhibitor subunit 1 (PI31)
VSPSFYPHDFEAADAPPLVHGFISSNRIADLMFQFKLQIIQKIIPGLRKEGYAEDNGSATSSSAAPPQAPQYRQPARPQPVAPPHAPENIPYYPSAQIIPSNPLQVGRRDLDPIINQQNPFSPPSLFPPHGGDGMFVGPDHPIFGGGLQGAYPGGRGPWGGDGYLPPIGAPPGARFDPVTPTIGPFPGMGGAFGRGRGGGRSPGNTYDPDNDEFMPPGAVRSPPCIPGLV